MKPLLYLIIGCGHFGRRAVEKLLEKDPDSKITVIDENEETIKKVSDLPVETVMGDGLVYLNQSLSKLQPNDYIIPAVPFHLAFEFILSQLKSLGARRRKVPFLSGLPNPMMGKTGDLYTSIANFICPEDCPEPPQYCTMTRIKRKKPLCQMLKDLQGPFESKVIQSRQLGLGVGGFQVKVLLELLEDTRKRTDSNRPILLSTACRCHGVTSALSFI